MKNNIIFFIRSKLSLKVKGPNIERFIKRLKSNNIDILKMNYISSDEVNIKIYKQDYSNVIKIKTIYEITILDYYGITKFKNNILDNRIIILFITIALICVYILTNMIFKIEVVTNDSKMGKELLSELKSLGVKKYNFKLNYNKLQSIKKDILDNHKDEIEWIEIESIGTKYIIRYEPRIKNKELKKNNYRNIIAKKDSVIKNMNISSGQIIRGVNSYVKKGDIIVSGYIDLNGSIKDTVSSEGIVYGEVWYKVEITYPYRYKEIKETGKKKKVLLIKILNREIELFNFNKYKTKNEKNITLLKNSILPIKIVNQLQRETNVIDENNTEEELIEKAINLSKKKIEEKLNDGEYINDYKILNKTKHKQSVTLNIFFTVVENITDYEEIDKYEEIVE